MTRPYRLTGLELAAGWVPGHVDAATHPLPAPDGRSVRAALDAVVMPHLSARPCMVAFSGGRDSSVVLAVATALARREGLDPPVPVTRRYPGRPELDEEAWQRRVLDHLGLTDWLRLDFTDELDVVGPVARGVIARHGVVWPAAAHASVPLLAAATGGALLTGEGGDELFDPPLLGQVRAALTGVRPGRSGVARIRWVAAAGAPRVLRRRRTERVMRAHLPAWLTPDARHHLLRAVADDEASAPWGHRATLQRLVTRRAWQAGVRTLRCLADEAGTTIVHPLLAPTLLTALSEAAHPWGFTGRTAALQALFGALLPPDVLARRSKAVFNGALFAAHARAFAAQWSGEGLDDRLVDSTRLRAEWTADRPSVLSAPLLQQAWTEQRNRP